MIDLISDHKTFLYRGILETFFIALCLYYVIKKTTVIELIKYNKNSKKIFIVFFLIIFMQMFDRLQYYYPQSYDIYPFVRFAMYQAAPNGVELNTYRICMKDESENCREINIAKEYSTIGLPSLSSRFNYLINEYPNNQREIKLWLESLKRLKTNSEQKIVFQKVTFEKNKINYIDLVEVSFEK